MDIQILTEVADSERDQTWETKFFHGLSESNLQLFMADPQTGPDGWPYLLAKTSQEATEPMQKIIQWLATRGVGLVINPQKEFPDYVFSYGMIWSFKESGFFYKNNELQRLGPVEFAANQFVHAGAPTAEYLPGYVRKILQDFFRDQGIFAPKILMISNDKVNYDLAISLESLGSPKKEEHQGIAEAISWFLPPHYSLLLISEKDLPPFTEL